MRRVGVETVLALKPFLELSDFLALRCVSVVQQIPALAPVWTLLYVSPFGFQASASRTYLASYIPGTVEFRSRSIRGQRLSHPLRRDTRRTPRVCLYRWYY